jgi:hypothetical protein
VAGSHKEQPLTAYVLVRGCIAWWVAGVGFEPTSDLAGNVPSVNDASNDEPIASAAG